MRIIDSGFSAHMTGDRALLSNMVEKVGPWVPFGDNNKGFTKGYGNLGIRNVIIENISLVDGLKHNLLSVSQFTNKGYEVNFKSEHSKVTTMHNHPGIIYQGKGSGVEIIPGN